MYRFINAEKTAVVHLETSRCIYLDQPTTDHADAYLAWAAEGNTPDDYIAPPAIEINRKAELIAQISALDSKRIRPMVEGDMIYLGRLTLQIKALRDELKGLQ